MTQVYIDAVGVVGPGMPDWRTAQAVLRGERAYEPDRLPQPDAAMLPANERRRAASTVRWALAAAQEAMSAGGRAVGEVATVFASSGSDGETLHHMCEALASPERELSPTRFHNSVHNAASGYWGIANRAHEASTSLCCYDASFAAGLVEAVAQIAAFGKPVALIAYDQPYPEPLHSVRPLLASFATALVLTPHAASRAIAALDLEFLEGEAQATRMSDPGLEEMRLGAPAARALPLLQALTRKAEGNVEMDFLGDRRLRVAVSPC